MSERLDPTYSQLERALNVIAESKTKLDFLLSKIDTRLSDIDIQELSGITEQYIAIDGVIQNAQARLAKAKGDSLQASLTACKEKCCALQGKVQRLIEVKDSLTCQFILTESPSPNIELLPEGTRTQRMKLELECEISECPICNEVVKKVDTIWSCKKCFNILHRQCAQQWMDMTKKNGEWNCPTCRLCLEVVSGGLRYTCFCGRVSSPKLAPDVTPHSCGQTCLKGCSDLCHPGPCSAA